MIRLRLIAEFKGARTVDEARATLDVFREAVLPGQSYGITLYHADEHLDAPLTALARIHRTLDGQAWDADTLDEIARLMRAAGYEIAEPED